LTVALVTRADGSPRTGRTVRAVPAGGGGAVALPEVPGTPGAYQSALRTWAAADATFDLEVDGHPVDRFTLDPFRLDTRLHAVSPA
jgi:hypothetical protein